MEKLKKLKESIDLHLDTWKLYEDRALHWRNPMISDSSLSAWRHWKFWVWYLRKSRKIKRKKREKKSRIQFGVKKICLSKMVSNSSNFNHSNFFAWECLRLRHFSTIFCFAIFWAISRFSRPKDWTELYRLGPKMCSDCGKRWFKIEKFAIDFKEHFQVFME